MPMHNAIDNTIWYRIISIQIYNKYMGTCQTWRLLVRNVTYVRLITWRMW